VRDKSRATNSNPNRSKQTIAENRRLIISRFPPVKEQLERLKESVSPIEIVSEDELAERIDHSRTEERSLRIKQGFDASSPDLHLGHAVSIWKLKTFQDLGHKVFFVIGDFTAMIGDPSGKSKTRPRLTREQVEVNARTYQEQVSRILDPDRTEIVFNSEWHSKRDIYDFLDLSSRYTVRRMLERDDFWKRFTKEQPISMLEFLYPLIQAYDSVALKADIEVGGNDQKFNLILARHIQRAYNQEPQVAFLMPLLRGTDGSDKMSKSLANSIGITDDPNDLYGKVMSIADELTKEYYVLASGLKQMDIDQAISKNDPYKTKHLLAETIVSRYYNSEIAREAAHNFLARFKEKEWPSHSELIINKSVVKIEKDIEWLPRIMTAARAVKSNSDAMRLIKSGAVAIDGEKLSSDKKSWDIKIGKPFIVKVGKRRYFLVYKGEEQLHRQS